MSSASPAAAAAAAAAAEVFTSSSSSAWPSPVGLSLGLLSVAVGQVFTIAYHYYRRHVSKPIFIQKANNKEYDFWEGVRTHLAQPEGFVLLGGYLCGTWMYNLMPASYYDMTGSVNWLHVLAQLMIVVSPFIFKICPLAPSLFRTHTHTHTHTQT